MAASHVEQQGRECKLLVFLTTLNPSVFLFVSKLPARVVVDALAFSQLRLCLYLSQNL